MQIAITNRGSNQIQPEIIKQMNTAQRSVWVAVVYRQGNKKLLHYTNAYDLLF